MKKIEIEDDLYKYILANIQAFGETPSEILRRLLSLPEITVQDENVVVIEENSLRDLKIKNTPVDPSDIKDPRQLVSSSPSSTSLPNALSFGIQMLFENDVFKKETVITNKFKMMLTAMYYEDKDSFMQASKEAKGRSRDYLGLHLDRLLASENTEELAQFIASKPRQIPYTPFWVVTNANTGRKRIILTKMMVSMGYNKKLVEQIQSVI
ncbi:replication initiation regulator SeqA [Psychromonas sp. CD1]|uniref:replication initiation regulator SeqA n=1 Tax=Psychromonas sp. CD1 TaxID=1979839 RepID=UPI000B9B099D|nr:replication initiation regulator SeqA [Psychromonas sp. CD1]